MSGDQPRSPVEQPDPVRSTERTQTASRSAGLREARGIAGPERSRGDIRSKLHEGDTSTRTSDANRSDQNAEPDQTESDDNDRDQEQGPENELQQSDVPPPDEDHE